MFSEFRGDREAAVERHAGIEKCRQFLREE